MAIRVNDIISFVRTMLAEDEGERFWKTPQLLPIINSAVRFLFLETYWIREELFLKKGTITTASGQTSYPLPEGCIYVSDLERKDPERETVDFRPLFGSKRLIRGVDYWIDGVNFVLKDDPKKTETITFYYKALPAKVTSPSETLDSIIPDIYFDAICEYVLIYATRRDENPDMANMLAQHLRTLRQTLGDMMGHVRYIRHTWNI